jgi:hypothetical protein
MKPTFSTASESPQFGAMTCNRTIEDGLQRVAEECVKRCSTGALVFD